MEKIKEEKIAELKNLNIPDKYIVELQLKSVKWTFAVIIDIRK